MVLERVCVYVYASACICMYVCGGSGLLVCISVYIAEYYTVNGNAGGGNLLLSKSRARMGCMRENFSLYTTRQFISYKCYT